VRQANGDMVEDYHTSARPVLDPRVAAVVVNMMQNVMDHGTGAMARERGFTAPAAGKTGTSHDGWFAGFTSNLLCIVWVGYDDYSNLNLTGGGTAGPIWAEFMKKAVRLPQYSNTQEFAVPAGVTLVTLDKATNLLSTPSCPEGFTAAFIEGTEPRLTCEQGEHRNFLQKMLGLPGEAPPAVNQPLNPDAAAQRRVGQPKVQPIPPPTAPTQPAQEPKKKSLWERLFGGGDKDKDQN
jgi:penicillin-binding protein 1B